MNDEPKFKISNIGPNNEMPESVRQFIRNVNGASHHSIYHIQAFDKDGNQTDEKFGMNLMTNAGLTTFYYNKNFTMNNPSLSIGRGALVEGSDSEYKKPSITDTGLFSAISTGSTQGSWWPMNMNTSEKTSQSYEISAPVSALSKDTSTYAGPMEYDSDRHLLIVRHKLIQSMWDYNISGITSTQTIREVGMNIQNAFCFHSGVYDIDGNESYIEKHVNERIYITVYISFCINVDVVNKAYNDGIYLILSPNIMTWLSRSGSFEYHLKYGWAPFFRERAQSAIWYVVSRWWEDYEGWHTPPTIYYYEDSITSPLNTETHRIDVNAGHNYWGFTLDQYPGTQYISGFSFGIKDQFIPSAEDYMFASSFMTCFTFDGYDEANAEELTTPNAWTNSINSEYFTNLFGRASYKARYNANGGILTDHYNWMNSDGELPCTNFNITALKAYNHLTHDWDIDLMPVTVNGGRAMKYEYTQWRRCVRLYMNVDGSNKFIEVYVNPFTNYTITGFSNTGITLKATNEYWDPSTYITITDLAELPPEAQHCRYYVLTAGWNDSTGCVLSPIYADDYITGESTGYKQHRFDLQNKYINVGSTIGNLPALVSRSGRGDPTNYPCDLMRPCSSDKNHWFATMKNVVYMPDPQHPETAIKHTISPQDTNANGGQNFTPCYMYCTDDRIISISAEYYNNDAGRYVRIYDLTDIDTYSTSTTLPYNQLTLPYHSQTYNTVIYPSLSIVDDSEAYLVIQTVGTVANVVDIYNETSTQITGDVKGAFALNMSRYCAYQDTSESGIVVKILDMSTMTIVNSIIVGNDPDITYTLQGIFGWRDHLYIKYTAGETSICLYYNITDNDAKRMDDWTDSVFSMYNGEFAKYGGIVSVDDCMVLASGNRSIWSVVISYDEPTKWYTLLRNGIQQNTSYRPSAQCAGIYLTFPQLRYTDNGRRLILTGNGRPNDDWTLNYMRVIDIGQVIDDPDNRPNYYPLYHFWSTRDSEGQSSTGSVHIFSDGILLIRYVAGSSGSNVTWHPIDLCVSHKMTGTTTTINNFYNPISVTGKWFSFAYSNDLDTILGVTDEYQASLQNQEEDPET